MIAGQFVSGFSAQAAWKHLLEISSRELTPEHVLALISDDSARIDPELFETNLRKPAGLTKAKAASIVDLALHFQEGMLSEHFLMTTIDETEIRKAPLQVEGMGLSSCDMCLIFFGATGCFTDWRSGCSKRHSQVFCTLMKPQETPAVSTRRTKDDRKVAALQTVLLATCLLHVAGCRHAIAGGLSN
ncbi:hypothetical protein FisN_16Lu198 [Fistulifera solaris]|uniref:Uncharacterized protein n=1 Tax=Fistulifera solaris TaxID=1519565 RepID=A0A1Z5KJ96_FISSO|nr:hypothetical protein FisN_16Lu198 [Fistulifera solaris]|eukprot:GAX26354.1 hypothetical protein FisN_16Lu198 [Fistulifera solaris]